MQKKLNLLANLMSHLFADNRIADANLAANDDVYYNCLSENVHLFDAETEMSIYKEEEAA